MERLGIQPIPLLLQVINFTVLVFLLNKFLYTPILKALDARRKKIEEGLEFANQMKVEQEKTEKKRQETLAKARAEGGKIIEEAKIAGKRVEDEILEKARREAAQIIEKAQKDSAAEREKTERELKNRTVEIAASIVEKVLKGALDEKSQISIIDKKIKEIAKNTL